MPIRSIHLLTALAIALCAPALHPQSGLRLAAIREAGREGVGILRPRAAGECFVVVPRHVADPDAVSTLRAVTDAGAHATLETVLARYSTDLGLWRMPWRMDRTACAAWPSPSAVNRALERAQRRGTPGVVTPRTPSGPGEQVRVGISGLTATSFRLSPLDGQNLLRGMSGSPVHVNGTFVGIVTEIDMSDGDRPYGVALRLDYVEKHLKDFFDPGRPPGDPLILASIVAPGLGQARTRRPEAALLWASAAAGPTLYALFTSRQEQVPRTRILQDGREEIYYETRSVNPYRERAWIPWITVGIGSFLEARAHAGRHYIPPERTDPSLRRRARLHVEPRISPDAAGGTRVQVAELRF
jgi:hypothetical protein